MKMINNQSWIKVAKTYNVEYESPISIEIDDYHLAIYRDAEDNFYATDNVCTHAYALLTEGFQEGCTIECPLHAGCFDIRTGEALTAPLTENLKTYPVRIDGDDILVYLDA